jgi:hypothetical protein
VTANTVKDGGDARRTERDTIPPPHPPPHFSTHNKQHKGEARQRKGNRTTQRRPAQRRGTPQHTPPPPFNTATTQTEEGRQHTDGEDNNTAALHSPCHPTPQYHPTIHNTPTHYHCKGGVTGGYPTTQTPQTHTLHHTPHTRQDTAHDTTAAPMSTTPGRARHGPHAPGRAGQQHTPPPFNSSTQQRMDTIHSHTVHVHTTNKRS